MKPDKLDSEDESILVDFLIWLGKENLIPTQQMPSGALRYGHSLRDPVEILMQYWETYQ